MSDLEEFVAPEYGVASVGPFSRFPLTVNGWTVPNVQVYDAGRDGDITFVLDNRLALDVPAEHAGRVASWVADVVAVTLGYACHPRESSVPGEPEPPPPRSLRPWRQMVGLTHQEAAELLDHEEGDDG